MHPERADDPDRTGDGSDFIRSLPLFVAAGTFLGLGVWVRITDATYGPGLFRLWALLIAMGTVSAIGAVASWLLVEEPRVASSGGGTARTGSTGRRTRLRGLEPSRPIGPSRVDPDFGRPPPEVHAPDVRRAGASPEMFRQGGARVDPRDDAPRDTGMRPARGSGTSGPPPHEVLHDLDRIEAELRRGSRAPRDETASSR